MQPDLPTNLPSYDDIVRASGAWPATRTARPC